jgi:fructosamine-3-kinase
VSWATTRDSHLPDGRRVVVKDTTYDARLEAEGLDALRDAGAPVPAIVEVEAGRLVLEHVGGSPDWEGLGRALAHVHHHTGDAFGWHRDNVIGPLPQDNTRRDTWTELYVQQRVLPYLGDVPADLAWRLERACAGPLRDLLEHDAVPSLTHGDLWSGNVVAGRWLIDPAVSYADRELDLAFGTLFGGIPDVFHRAYADTWPLDDGWQERRPALQLYHLLVHCRLFGGSYVRSVEERLARYGW